MEKNVADKKYLKMVGRASVPPSWDTPSNLRRNSSRASRKATQEPDANDPVLSRTSYSLPTTPLATSFDESLPQSKRRKTQRSVNGDEKVSSPSQEVPEIPDQKDVPDGSRAAIFIPEKSEKNGKPEQLNGNGDTTQEDGSPKDHSTDHVVTSTISNGKRKPQPAKSQSNLHAFLEPESRLKSLTAERELAEPKNDKPNTKTSAQASRKARKSMPARLKKAEDLENNNQPQTTTPRPDRKAKVAAHANAEVLKSSSRTKTRSTPKNLAVSKSSQDQTNGTADSVSPASLPAKTRRRNHKSIAKTQGGPSNPTNATPSQSASRRKRGGPVEDDWYRDHEMMDSTLQSPDDTHSGNDTELYGDSFGIDGQTDGPTSPKSLSNNSLAARTSRRARKPTMRAMESLESEKRFRRRKAADEQNALHLASDLGAVAQRLYELAAEAVSPDFVATPDAKVQLTQLQQEYWDKKRQIGNADGGKGVTLMSKPTFSKKTKVSEPWADERGWMHTGHVNEHGEEYLFVPPEFDLYRPNNTYNDAQLPEPPIRLRSHEQAQKDHIFGFPPRIGERNTPQNAHLPFMFENVDEERARIQARKEARQHGIIVDRYLSVAEILALIAQHGRPMPPSPKEPGKIIRRRRRRTQPVADDGSDVQPKPRRRRRQPATAPGTPIQEPESPDKRTMKIKLKFGKGTAVSSAGQNDTNEPSGKSRKRGLSATGEISIETPVSGGRSTKKRKLSMSELESAAKPDTPTAAVSVSDMKIDDTPASASTQRTDPGLNDTPRGRPRRRAAATVMTDFQTHAERARRTNTRNGPATPSVSGSHDTANVDQMTESFDTA